MLMKIMRDEKFNWILKQIKVLATKYDIDKIFLFGSRARGDNSNRSDIDLAVYTKNFDAKIFFRLDLEEIETLLKFDVVFIDDNTSEKLLDEIKKDGVSIYEKK